VRADVLAGRIPLSAVPFLLNKPLNPEERRAFLEENDIMLLPPPGKSCASNRLRRRTSHPGKRRSVSREGPGYRNLPTPGHDGRQAPLRSSGFPNRRTRPEGVYLIRKRPGVGRRLCPGDIQELVAAVEGPYQVISFRLEEGVWVLKYSPTESRTSFLSPQEEENFDLVPLG